MPDDRKSLLRSLFYQFDPVGLPGGVDLREAGEVQEGIFVRVDLVVYLGYVAFVGAEHGRKGAEFYPAQEEFFGAMVLEHGIVYGGVAADVRMFEAVAREPAGEQARHGALDAVVFVPVDELVPGPEQRAVAGALRVAGAVEEDDVLAPAGLVYSLTVHPSPLLGVAVVVGLRVGSGEQYRVIGESLAEVGHPAGGSTIDELPFDYLLDPDPRLRVRQIHEGRGEAGDRDPVRLSIPILYQIAVSCGLLKEVAAVILLLRGVFTEERVYVGHEPDIPLLQALPQRTPVWVVIPVQLPVPPELGAEAGLPLPHPVL